MTEPTGPSEREHARLLGEQFASHFRSFIPDPVEQNDPPDTMTIAELKAAFEGDNQ